MCSRVFGIYNFLEVCCRTGFVFSAIAKAFPRPEIEASEYFEAVLGFAGQRLPRSSFLELVAIAIPENNLYDCIGSFDVIEHINADQINHFNFLRVFRHSGLLSSIANGLQHPRLWSSGVDYAHHVDAIRKIRSHRRFYM